MFTKESIEAIAQATAISEAHAAMTNALNAEGTVALPENFKVHDLEKQLPYRRHMRGTMSTDNVGAFANYTKTHAAPGASVFISREAMAATAVLNMGNVHEPGHCDNLAKLKLTARAEYLALRLVIDQAHKQQTIAEFLEDWQDMIQCYADSQPITNAKAVAAVRNITIEAARKVESEEQQLSATRSSLESVTASSKHTLPTHIYFECSPYAELPARTFVLRLGIQTGDKDPRIVLRIIKQEEHQQAMSEEFADIVNTALEGSDINVLIGTYNAS